MAKDIEAIGNYDMNLFQTRLAEHKKYDHVIDPLVQHPEDSKIHASARSH